MRDRFWVTGSSRGISSRDILGWLMSVLGAVLGRIRQHYAEQQQKNLLAQPQLSNVLRGEWDGSLTDPTGFYRKMFRLYNGGVPAEVREHRSYFRINRRGFGEDAFHAMWFLLFREFRPENFLEIGIYRGQVISLASLLMRHFGINGEVVGISPFSSAGDAVSKYMEIDYEHDTHLNFAHFRLPTPTLLKSYSSSVEARALIDGRCWDLIYIDGCHDYEVAHQDWVACSRAIKRGGIIVLDDASLETGYRPLAFSTAGHPGPSQVAREIDGSSFREILRVGHNRVFQAVG